ATAESHSGQRGILPDMKVGSTDSSRNLQLSGFVFMAGLNLSYPVKWIDPKNAIIASLSPRSCFQPFGCLAYDFKLANDGVLPMRGGDESFHHRRLPLNRPDARERACSEAGGACLTDITTWR